MQILTFSVKVSRSENLFTNSEMRSNSFVCYEFLGTYILKMLIFSTDDSSEELGWGDKMLKEMIIDKELQMRPPRLPSSRSTTTF
jgi:hypothetical protein